MIQRFSFGHPFPTQSVVLSLPAESGPVPFLTPDDSGWRFTLSEQAAVYGLGEMPRGINKRGWHYITNNTDESRHSEDKLSFYGAHNFLLVRDGSTYTLCAPLDEKARRSEIARMAGGGEQGEAMARALVDERERGARPSGKKKPAHRTKQPEAHPKED